MQVLIYFLVLFFISCNNGDDLVRASFTKKDSTSVTVPFVKIKADSSEKIPAKNTIPASTIAVSQCSCEVSGYFEETQEKIIVYPSPVDSGGKIIYTNVSFIFAEIENNRGNWFQLKKITTNEDIEYKKYRHWWVKAGEFSTCTSEINYTLKLFNFPSNTSKVIGYLPESSFPILQCSGAWIKVQGRDDKKKKVQGWVRRDILCGNPYTNCGYSLKKKYIYKMIRL